MQYREIGKTRRKASVIGLEYAPPMGRAHYQGMKATGKDCIACGSCEERCPFGLPVIRDMSEAAHLQG